MTYPPVAACLREAPGVVRDGVKSYGVAASALAQNVLQNYFHD